MNHRETSAISNPTRTVLLAVMLLYSTANFAQTPVPPNPSSTTEQQSKPAEVEEDKVFEKVEVEASFPGGDHAWRRYLEQNLNAGTPAYKGAPGGAYTVIIQFVVDKEGKVSDIKALTSHGFGMEAEVIRLLRKAPRWNPALQEGRPVKAYRKQPVTFMVIEEEKMKKKKKD